MVETTPRPAPRQERSGRRRQSSATGPIDGRSGRCPGESGHAPRSAHPEWRVFSRIRHGSSGSHRREKAWLISRHCDAARPARSPPGCEALRHHSGTIPAPFAAGLALPLQPRRAMETVLEHPPTLTAAQRPRRVCNDQVAR